MDSESIRRAFFSRPVQSALPLGGARPAAALVPIEPGKGVWLTRRSAFLSTHAGQVAFPGGKIDEADASPEMAALREAQEEVGLDPAQVTCLGRLPDHVTITGFHITPVVGLLPAGVSLWPASMEVEEIFLLPFPVLLNPDYPIQRKIITAQGERCFWVWPHADHVIWGATALILRHLALCLCQAR